MTQGKHSELTLLDHKTDVAALLEAIKDVPCGTARRGRTKTLSQAIAGLPCTNSREPIGKQAVSRLAFAIHAHKAQLEYGRVLRDAYEETKSGDRQANSNLFVSFISMLASRDLDMLLTICKSIDSEWQRVVVETLELELADMKTNHIYAEEDILKALKASRGIVSAAARRMGMTRRQLTRVPL